MDLLWFKQINCTLISRSIKRLKKPCEDIKELVKKILQGKLWLNQFIMRHKETSMKSFFFKSLIALLFSCQCYALPENSSSFDLGLTRFQLGYSVGKFISIDQDYAKTGLFIPLNISPHWTSFIDVNAYRFNDCRWASSDGLGIRRIISESSLIGVNAYYDYRRGEARHNFHRIGLGFEWLNTCFDVRINGYLPVGNKTQTSSFYSFNNIGGGFFATRRKIEYAYRGFDAEIGLPFWNQCDSSLYISGGPYYYFRHRIQHFWGGFGRLMLNWNSMISVELRASYDRVYSAHFQGCVQLSIPFDFFCPSTCGKSRCDWFLTQPTRRNGIIQTDHCCNWTWNWNDKI